MISKINIIGQTLSEISDNVGHYEAVEKKDKYFVWAEDSEGSSVSSDNFKSEQTIQGTVDYFTKSEDDENVDKVQKAFKKKKISFRLNSVQYESETEFIHYEWVWEVA